MRKTNLRLETGRATDCITVRVEDEISGTTIVSFTLDPEQTFALLGGTSQHIDGQITEHFDRVGKTMRVDSVVYTQQDLRASTYDQAEGDAEQLARADRPGWDTYSAHRRGGGYGAVQVTMRRWE